MSSSEALAAEFASIDIYLFDQLLRGRIQPGMRILDAGCGSGRNLHYLARAGYEIFGVDRDLFNEREVLHMIDVKGLIRGVSFWQQTSFYTMVGLAVVGLAVTGRGRTLQLFSRGLFRGSVFALGLLIVLGIGSLVGFEALFERFHFLSFSNDLWRLDPRRDYLIRIFPEGFFLSATLIVAGLTIGQALLTSGIIWTIRRRGFYSR